jgi:hypothetical protein
MAPRLNNLSSYRKYIRENLKVTKDFKLGGFYSYNYKFSLDYEFDKLKFFDWLPISFIMNINMEKKTFVGLNLHHMPVKSRQIWLSRLKKRYPNKFEIGGIKLLRELADEDLATKLLLKSKIAIRNYRFDRVRDLRIISLDQIEEIIRFYSNTYFAVNMNQINNRYNQYIP